MITAKTKAKSKKEATKSKIEVANKNLIEIQNRKTFFENALANLNNNPFRIVMLQYKVSNFYTPSNLLHKYKST